MAARPRRRAPAAHRRKRERRPLPGMMLHQDGSTHEWVPGQWWDLIVTMDDATSDIHSAFLVKEEGTMSTVRALGEVIAAPGLFGSLCADRASHYWHTPEAGGKVDRDNPTQVGRALAQLGIELIPAYSPEARGRSERMFGTLQKRLPQELRLDDILCVQEGRTAVGDNTVRYKNRSLQIPADRHRHHYVKARVRVHEYPDGTLAVFHGPRRLACHTAQGEPIDEPDKRAA